MNAGTFRRAAIVAVMGLLVACAGPQAPLEVGMNARSVDLLLGARAGLVTKGPVFPPIGITVPGVFGPRVPGTFASPPAQRCPTAAPNAPYLVQAPPKVALPPSAATYRYATTGEVRNGEDAVKLPAVTTRTIEQPRKEETGSYTFDVVTTIGDAQTTTSFRIVPEWFPTQPPTGTIDSGRVLVEGNSGQEVPDEHPEGSRIQPGLYLTRIDADDPDVRFSDPGMKVVDFPIKAGATFRSAATDGVTTVNYTSTVPTSRPRVDACGTLIDVLAVDLSGQIARRTPTGEVVTALFTSSYGIATQYGGVIVWERAEVASGPVSRRIEATITSVPAAAKEPS
jgi:hypothetical protein